MVLYMIRIPPEAWYLTVHSNFLRYGYGLPSHMLRIIKTEVLISLHMCYVQNKIKEEPREMFVVQYIHVLIKKRKALKRTVSTAYSDYGFLLKALLY